MQQGTPSVLNVNELNGIVLTGIGGFKVQAYIPSDLLHALERNIFW
jgi:hypothetical protein